MIEIGENNLESGPSKPYFPSNERDDNSGYDMTFSNIEVASKKQKEGRKRRLQTGGEAIVKPTK